MIEAECRLSFHGVLSPIGPNQATIIVNDYLEKKVLAKLGYKQDIQELSDFDAKCYLLCHSQFAKLEEESLRKGARRGK